MSKGSTIMYLIFWATILMQGLRIRALNKQIENEKEWSEFWREAWLKERSRR